MIVIRIVSRFRTVQALVIATIGLGVSPMLGDAFAASPSKIPCRPGRAKLLAANTQAVVYVGSVVDPSTHLRIKTFLGCARGGRRAFEVGGPGESSSSGGSATRNLTLTGQVVGWEEHERTTGTTGELGRDEWTIIVRNLRTGRILHKLPTGAAIVREWTGVGPTTEIVVSASGDVAWIARVADAQGLHGYEVHVADKAGSRLLATGSNIAPNSLALAGNTLYWTQGGQPSSAPLS